MGRTPLHYAAVDGNVDEVRRLLGSDCDPGATDGAGWTALHFAAQANSPAIAALLLDAGAPVDARDDHGNTPLWRAVFNCDGVSGELIGLLRDRGASPHAENLHGVSPVSLAWTIGNYDVRQFFEDLPSEPDA